MEGLSTTLCFGVLLIVGVIVLFIIMRRMAGRKEPPAGTYDSPDHQSGGSIGKQRGGRAHDSEEFESGASIGGQRGGRAHDSEEFESGASIGGRQSVGKRPGSSRAPARERTVSDGWETSDVGGESESAGDEEPRTPYRTRKTGKRVDSPDIKSGGSFGG